MTKTDQGDDMTQRESFNQQMIQGLWKCRNKRPEVRPWLRQCIELERKRTK
jgi:hypothetical protein